MIVPCDTAESGVVARSFRDPAGTVLRSAGRILRAVEPGSVAELEAFLATQAARGAIEAGQLVTSARLSPGEAAELNMLVTERVPLEELLSLAAELTGDYLLIEFVAPPDPMFQRIVRGREALYDHLTPQEAIAWLTRQRSHPLVSER